MIARLGLHGTERCARHETEPSRPCRTARLRCTFHHPRYTVPSLGAASLKSAVQKAQRVALSGTLLKQ